MASVPARRPTRRALRPRGSESPSRRTPCGFVLTPGRPHERQDDALREPIARLDGDRRRGEVDDFNLDLVVRTAVVRIDDADAIGHHQSPLERRATACEDSEE